MLWVRTRRTEWLVQRQRSPLAAQQLQLGLAPSQPKADVSTRSQRDREVGMRYRCSLQEAPGAERGGSGTLGTSAISSWEPSRTLSKAIYPQPLEPAVPSQPPDACQDFGYLRAHMGPSPGAFA